MINSLVFRTLGVTPNTHIFTHLWKRTAELSAVCGEAAHVTTPHFLCLCALVEMEALLPMYIVIKYSMRMAVYTIHNTVTFDSCT